MTPENWEQFADTVKRIDPETGQRYVRLYVNGTEQWEEVKLVPLDDLLRTSLDEFMPARVSARTKAWW